jgi:hypothetical protein
MRAALHKLADEYIVQAVQVESEENQAAEMTTAQRGRVAPSRRVVRSPSR